MIKPKFHLPTPNEEYEKLREWVANISKEDMDDAIALYRRDMDRLIKDITARGWIFNRVL